MKAFLGIDVSKGYADFFLLSHEGKKLEDTFQLDDTQSGHNLLVDWMKELHPRHGVTALYCGVESTGGLENNWLATLKGTTLKIDLFAVRLNPSVVVNAAKAELHTNVTDSESARNIASYIRRYEDEVDYEQNDNLYCGFRSLHNHIQMQTKQKSQIINELKQLLYSSFPELQRYCKKSIPTWVLKLLIGYPTAQKLSKAKVEKLVKIPTVTKEKALKLIASAKLSVASRNSSTDEFIIKNMAEEIKHKQEKIKELKAYLETHCQGYETKLLETIKGIGAYSAASLMVQIEDVNRFKSAKELASYFGLHPVIRESGDKKAVSRMSKQGRPAVRATLYMCANSAVLCDLHLKAIYARHRAKGKNHNQALGVIMHKMLRIVWGVLKNKQAYNSAIDAQNQNKKPQKIEVKEQQTLERKRRLQSFDQEAPISRLAYKKRKAQALSQSGEASKVQDLQPEPVAANI